MIKKFIKWILPTNKCQRPDDFRGELYQTFRRINTYPSESMPKNCKRGNTSKLILWLQNHLNIKSRHHKIKIAGQYHWWTLMQKIQQNISNMNPTIYEKDYTPWTGWLSRRCKEFSISANQLVWHITSRKWKWKLLNRVRLFVTLWTIQSMELSRPEYWSE